MLSSQLVLRSATIHDINSILALHREAFADKFGRAFGHDGLARGSAALAAAWRRQGNRALRGMIVAEWQHQIIATTTLRTWELGEDDAIATETAFQQELGLWGATRSMFILSLLNHPIGRQEGFITDVAVLSEYRRRGVACALLQHAEKKARQHGKHYLALYVSSTNRGAIALYKQLGFYRARTRRSWLTRLCFGQRTWYYLRKDLA